MSWFITFPFLDGNQEMGFLPVKSKGKARPRLDGRGIDCLGAQAGRR
jgi:hypothetical protein